jgi:hypothetical protein
LDAQPEGKGAFSVLSKCEVKTQVY